MSDYLQLSSLEINLLIHKFKSKEGKILNEIQCRDLLNKFEESVEILQRINNGPQKHKLNALEGELHRLVMKAKVLVEECCKEEWCWAALMQLNNKESFRELLSELECCFHTFCSIIQNAPSDQDKGSSILERITFYPTSIDEVEKDMSSLQDMLLEHLKFPLLKPQREFMRYVLERLEGLQHVEGGELDNIILPVEYPRPIYDCPPSIIGGSVCKAHWQGLEVAVKLIKAENDACKALVLKEAGILGGLSHPNIIKFLLCGFIKERDTFELVMELGLGSLASLLNEQKESLNEAFAIDIMLQIASGMCYLHDMKVAHRDLKPENVVVTAKDCKYIHVKLIDFGISKIEVENILNEPTGRWQFGTTGFIAPECIKKKDPGSLFLVNACKADVFSFGMLCYVILARSMPFEGFDYNSSVQNGKRPNLPTRYSKGLRSMIEDCWCFDPSKRPTFLDIHNTLTTMKTTMLKDSIKIEAFQHIIPPHDIALAMVPNQGTFTNFIDKCYGNFAKYNSWLLEILRLCRWNFTSSQPLVNDTMNGTLKLIGYENRLPILEMQLESHGGLGIIGMGGIGKSTLANALSDYISHKFDAICFVDGFDAGRYTFTTKYKSQGLEKSFEVKTLEEGRMRLQQMQDSKKILVVLDNVTKQEQLKKLLDETMFQNVGGSKLIASSRDWESLEGHIRPGGKVNMWTLDGEHPMELFLIHAFASNQPCLPYLKYVVRRIVEACGGLPLSLKVMGRLLRGETRLRIWERALHRLLRARQDEDPNLNIWKTLRISFDDLIEDEEKNTFLDIACFFCRDVCPEGVSKETLFKIYDKDIESPSKTLQILINKSLLEVDENDLLDMHDQLRDMGRMLAETKFKGTRFRNLCLSTFISSNHEGMKSVQGLSFKKLEGNSSDDEANWKLETMEHLRLLSVQRCENVCFLYSIVKECTKLKWLKIHFQVQHNGFALQERFDINMLFENNLTQLKVLEVHNCEFTELPPNNSFKSIPLEELSLMNCKSITLVLCHMTTLSCLRISRCEDFDLCKLVALEELSLSKCKSLNTIAGGFENLTCLKRLYMRELETLEVFPPGVSKLVKLEELDISKCKKLKKIPEGFGSLIRLKKLYMWECEDLEEFPDGLSKLSVLEELDFSRCKTLKMAPKGFENLKCLKKLYMWGCESLESFPNGLNKLTTLEDVLFSK